MSNPIIKTENLTYTYSQGTPFAKTAIDNISVEIERGDFIGVIGHTGSGKSTFIQHLNGLLKPTSGKVYIDGHDLWSDKSKLREYRFKVGLVFQYPEYQLFEETVYKDIAFGPTNMKLSKEEIDFRVREAAALVELSEEQLNASPFSLSGGQRRRAAIAGVLAMRPEVLILDEPTAGLDPGARNRILSQIKAYHEAGNGERTVMLVSHNMEDITRFSKKVLVINSAKLFMFDTTENVFHHSAELTEMGLSVPQVTKVFTALRERGVDVDPGVYTIEEALHELLPLLREGRDS